MKTRTRNNDLLCNWVWW